MEAITVSVWTISTSAASPTVIAAWDVQVAPSGALLVIGRDGLLIAAFASGVWTGMRSEKFMGKA